MKRTIIIHPILFAVYPILFLFSKNMEFISITEVILAIFFSILVSSFLWTLVTLVVKNGQRGGLIVSSFLFFFFSFGYFQKISLPMFSYLLNAWIGPRTLFSLIWVLLFLTTLCLLLKIKKNIPAVNRFMNIFSVLMVILILLTIGLRQIRTGSKTSDTMTVTGSYQRKVDLKKKGILPNIYYIILDGYGRSDVLKEIYQFDNSNFLDYLKQKGFYVAEKSRSNYAQTLLSLASSLNLRYFGRQDDLNPQTDDHRPLVRMIQYNKAIRLLKQFGYVSVGFVPDIKELEMLEFDFMIKNRFGLSEFQIALTEITPIYMFINKYTKAYNPFQNHRERIIYLFDHLGKISTMIKSPVFVYAHILIPHPPFVFGPNGEEVPTHMGFAQSLGDGSSFIEAGGSREEYIQNYKNQAVFATKKIQKTLDQILSNTTRPAVIILQGDHGPGSGLDWRDPAHTNVKERFSILNAYYFPGHTDYPYLYDSISPVNSFRILFNLYFNTHFELLQDESFFSTWDRPYQFIPFKSY